MLLPTDHVTKRPGTSVNRLGRLARPGLDEWLDATLADPVIRVLMERDKVTDGEIRTLMHRAAKDRFGDPSRSDSSVKCTNVQTNIPQS